MSLRRRTPYLLASALVSAVLPLAFAGTASAAPGNDDFARAATLRVGASLKGTINGATQERGEPRHADSIASHSVWFRLRSKSKAAVALDTCKSSFDTVLAVYTGRTLRSLKKVEFNIGGCGGGSRVTFTARRGTTYWIAVAGFVGKGRFTLTAKRIEVPPNDDFVDAVSLQLGTPIVATTRGATRELGEPRHAAGAAHTVWFRLTTDAAGRIDLDACNGYRPSLTIYTGRRVGALTRVGGGFGCTHRFDAEAGQTYRIVAESSRAGGSFRLSATAPAAP